MTDFYHGPYPVDMTPEEARAEVAAGLPALNDYRNRPPICNAPPQYAPKPKGPSGFIRGMSVGAPAALALWIAIAGGLGAIAIIFQ